MTGTIEYSGPAIANGGMRTVRIRGSFEHHSSVTLATGLYYVLEGEGQKAGAQERYFVPRFEIEYAAEKRAL